MIHTIANKKSFENLSDGGSVFLRACEHWEKRLFQKRHLVYSALNGRQCKRFRVVSIKKEDGYFIMLGEKIKPVVQLNLF